MNRNDTYAHGVEKKAREFWFIRTRFFSETNFGTYIKICTDRSKIFPGSRYFLLLDKRIFISIFSFAHFRDTLYTPVAENDYFLCVAPSFTVSPRAHHPLARGPSEIYGYCALNWLISITWIMKWPLDPSARYRMYRVGSIRVCFFRILYFGPFLLLYY